MAVMNAQYKHPTNSAYSQGLRDLIDSMLKPDPSQRPDIHQVHFVSRLYTTCDSDRLRRLSSKLIVSCELLLSSFHSLHAM